METGINQNMLADLIALKEQFNSIVESIELMNDKEFMSSRQKAKEQIKNRDFVNWDEL